MLYIWFSYMNKKNKEYIDYPSEYMDMNYKAEWFNDAFVRRIISEVDKTDVVACDRSVILYNETLGTIPLQYLSSGCKALILAYITDKPINGNRLGDNCLSLLLEIAREKDVEVSFGYLPVFEEPFECIVVNSGNKIATNRGLLREELAADESE